MCATLMRLFPRVSRGLRRRQEAATPAVDSGLGPRHLSALDQLRAGPLTVGALASELDLTLSTVSGVLGELARAELITREVDASDRRRTIVAISARGRADIDDWLDGIASPLARVLNRLDASERAAFLKAMDLLDAELRA
jgi:DNA-binding MarR family transcriptional regulator